MAGRDLFDDENDDNDGSEFARLFEDSMTGVGQKIAVGDKLRAEVLSVGKEEVFVSTGTVDDGVVLKTELADSEGNVTVQVGDFLDLFVTRIQGSQILLSPKPTLKNLSDDLEDAYNMGLAVEGKVTEAVNGGFRVSILGKTAFCPMSQIELRRVDDAQSYIGRKLEFTVTQFDSRGRNIVVSRRRLLEKQQEHSLSTFTEGHKPGDMIRGMITRLEPFGAFIEVAPGIEGLCHISELSWSRLAHPSDAVKPGQEVNAKILKIEQGLNGRMNVSLSVKQATPTPWENLPVDIREGQVVEGRVTRCMKFGAFVEIAPGIEGLVPLSEMSYTKRVVRSDELMQEGERVNVMIKEIRRDDQRVLLSLKDAGSDPFAMVAQKFPQGAILKGKIERREPYGLFVKIEEGVVGLLPKSKAMDAQFSFEKAKVGDEVTVQIDEIRSDDRRISLSIPSDPDAASWREFGASRGQAASGTKSMGTLGEQFKSLFAADADATKNRTKS